MAGIIIDGQTPRNIVHGRVGKFMENRSEDRKRIAAVLRNILEGAISPQEALNSWPDLEEDPSISAAKHAIEHFVADEDIRLKDKSYAAQQLSQLKGFQDLLGQGNPIDEREISWFSPRYLRPLAIFKKWLKRIQGGKDIGKT